VAKRVAGAVLSLGALVLGSGAGAPASGSGSGAATGTVRVIQAPPPVRSLTVSAATARQEGDCRLTVRATTVGARTATDGCATRRGAVTVTVGGVPSAVLVRTSAATPVSAGGPSWQPCGTTGARCVGSHGRPGRDQFRVNTFWRRAGDGTVAVSAATCDRAFGGALRSCIARAGQRSSEGLSIDGPSRSTSRARRFDVAITWTAGPPADGK